MTKTKPAFGTELSQLRSTARELRLMQPLIDAGRQRQQFFVAALLGDAGFVHDDDAVGVLDGRQGGAR